MKYSKNHDGLSFLEVIISVTVGALLLMALFNLFGGVTRSLSGASRTAEAITLASTYLAESLFRTRIDSKLQADSKKGGIPPIDLNFVKKLSDGAVKKPGLYLVRVNAHWEEMSARKTISLVTFVLDTTQEKKS